MSAPAVVLELTASLPTARELARRTGFSAFPVVDDEGIVLGVLEARRLAAATSVVAAYEPALTVAPPERAGALLDRTEFLRGRRAVVVDAAGRPLGMVSVTDLERRVRASRNLAAPARHGPAGVHR